MVFEQLKQKKYPSNSKFDEIYPKLYQEHSARHFTPVNIAIKAAKLLVDKPTDKILDIGSGVGKFCCIGSAVTDAHFYGVEKRKTLTNLSNKIKRNYKLKNAHFINNDFNMYWDSDEDFRIDIAIKVDSLWVEKLEEDEYYFETDKDEIESTVYEIYGDEPYLFEQPIWGCISDYLSDYTTFLNTEWQFVSVNIYVS